MRSMPGPIGVDGPVFRLYEPDYLRRQVVVPGVACEPTYAQDPHWVYDKMRGYHPDFARVELAPGVPATLVIGWRTAVEILHDTANFRADPSGWQDTVAPGCPVLSMLGKRANPLRSDGVDHVRYRRATDAALGGVDLREFHVVVTDHAEDLIGAVSGLGRMDLVADYALPLAFRTITTLLGCPPDIGADLLRGLAGMFDTAADADAVNQVLADALGALIDLKRAELERAGRERFPSVFDITSWGKQPASDVTSRLIAHAGGMSDLELREQVLTMVAAGFEPLQHLVSNLALLMMTDPRFGGQLVSGAYTTRDALDEVLVRNPPLPNLCARYPRQPIEIAGVVLPANQPVLIGMAACNTDPRVTRPADITGALPYNSSHLSYSTGPHNCPARTLSYQYATDAVDVLLDLLPELALACRPQELVWRPGPFQRALTALPVVFDSVAVPARTPRSQITARRIRL